MYHLRKIKVLLAICMLACASSWAQDTKISLANASATATSDQGGNEGASSVIDGDYSKFWHSQWYWGAVFDFQPSVDLTIALSEITLVDYVRYIPRQNSNQGHWGEVEVFYSPSTTGTSFISVGTFDLGKADMPHDFFLNGTNGVNCGQIKFTIRSGSNNHATAAEIEMYQLDKVKLNAFAQCFSDDVYSELKPGVASNSIADADVRTLVESMQSNPTGYKKFRVGEYKAYETLGTLQQRLKTKHQYSRYENPTGVYFTAGQSYFVAVSGIGDDAVGLRVKNWYLSESTSTYPLRNGLNYITATTEGNVFVSYYTDDYAEAPEVKVHFINAPVIGYWDQATMTNADWVALLADKASDDHRIIITQSEHAQTAFPISAWKTHCPTDVETLMGHYQDVQWAIRDMMGLEKYGYQTRNRQIFYVVNGGFMAAGAEGAFCNYSSLGGIMNPNSFDFWGVGHEWGHNNQIDPGFYWSGCGETTNNIYASWAQYRFTPHRDDAENPYNLRLEDEKSGIDEYSDMRGGRMQTYFEEAVRKGVAWQLQDGPDYHGATPDTKTVTGRDAEGNDIGQVTTTSRNYDHFVKLTPFWQLNLWGNLAEKCPDIITDVIHSIRTAENYTATYNTNGKQQINWMKLACDHAGIDLLPFFEKAGMLVPIHAYIEDYGAGWNIITEEMINELKAYVAQKGYPAYTEEINYINAHNMHIYRDNLKLNVTGMQGELNGDKLIVQHSVAQNAVAFETYNAQDELIRITMYGLGSNDEHSFTQVLYPSDAAYVMAVGYDGERQRVYQTYANEDEAKYGELGRILTGVEAMQAFCNDTKVGYYKSSALTDLNAAYDIAKAVYDNKQSAKYAAVYDMLNTEFMKVQNDAAARVGIVEGNAYRLTNRAYPTRSMSVGTNDVMIGEQTNDNDEQKWYFEGSGTEGYYYLKNKATGSYPGNVETSQPLSLDKTREEAYAYKLQDMGDGIWALVGATGLHCASSQSYNIVGWGADAEATQWYITVVETNTDAEALNNLQVLVDKAEALIAEIKADVAYSTISTSTAQSKVDAANNVIASGTYDAAAAAYDTLNEQYTALLNAKHSVDNAALNAKKQALSTLIGSTNSLIAQCGTVTFNAATLGGELKLQADNSANSWYVSSNADQNTGGGLKDGDGIAALVDDNTSTYFHTRWGGTVVNEPHYIQVDMGEGKTIQEFVFSYTPRSGSPAPTAMTIYGSNNATSFTQVLATITSGLPAHNSGNSYESSTINSGGAAYRYLRFVVTKSAGPGNAQYNGQYFFGMMEFDITEMAKPESYTVTLGNDHGDVTEELLLTAFKAVQEAQSVVDYANTEAQVNEAIEKLQEQYQTLDAAKNVVQYVDFTISSNVTGGGVIYNEGNYTTTLNAPSTLAAGDLTAITLDGYVAQGITVEGTTITVTYTMTLPVILTTDIEAPVLYTIKSKRGNTMVLQYEPASDHMFSVAEVAANSAKQAFFFMESDVATQVYVYPFAAGEQVLSADDTGDGADRAFAKEKGTATYEKWMFVKQTVDEATWYNLQPVGTSTYFSHYGGGSNKMGFYGSNPEEDGGSLFQFESTTVEGSGAYNSLKVYYDEATKGANIVGGDNPGYYPAVQAEAYNEAYASATALLNPQAITLGRRLTAEELSTSTVARTIAIKCVQENSYDKWVSKAAGLSSTSTLDADAVFSLEPADDGKGTYYLKVVNQVDGYFQTSGYSLGAKSGAQDFVPVKAVQGGSGNTAFGGNNADLSGNSDLDNLVRFVLGSSDGTMFLNPGFKAYNNGTGVWTVYNVYEVFYNWVPAYNDYLAAYQVLLAANNALVMNMPEVGKYYMIRSAHTGYAANKLIYATGDNTIRWDLVKTEENPEAVWTFTSEGYLENLNTGCAMNTGSAEAKLGDNPKTMSIKGISTDGQVLITPAGGTPLHADQWGHAVSWGTYDAGSASAWRIVEVEDMSLVNFTLKIGQYRHAGLYLNYAAEIPEGVEVYIAHTPDGEAGSIFADKLEGTVLPARTAVIIKGDEGEYSFKYTTDENTIDAERIAANLLGGSAYLKYQQVAEGGNLCCVFGQKGGEVGLYKNWVGYADVNGTAAEDTNGDGKVNEDGGTHFKVSANKIYYEYEPASVSGASAFRFRFNSKEEGTTAIDQLMMTDGAVIYNLYGQRIAKVVEPGIYVVNGKKIYVSEKMIRDND